jgi:hypothetical protein
VSLGLITREPPPNIENFDISYGSATSRTRPSTGDVILNGKLSAERDSDLMNTSSNLNVQMLALIFTFATFPPVVYERRQVSMHYWGILRKKVVETCMKYSE